MDLQEKDIAAALGDRGRTWALLEHLQSVSSPNTGTAKLLLVTARMATTACDWVEGDLTIELHAAGEETRVDVVTELGGGLRERLFQPLTLKASLVEFTRALERVPHMVAPLSLRSTTGKRIVLTASAALRRTTVPPPPVEISAESLYVRPAPLPAVSPETAGTSPASLPLVAPGVLPVVSPGALPPAAPAPPAAAPGPSPTATSVPPGDVDAGWDD